MKKNIIIQGPQGSGKTSIANAIAYTHEHKLITTASKVLKLIEHEVFPTTIPEKYTLMIIDECSHTADIATINHWISGLPGFEHWNGALNMSKRNNLTVVYCTQAHFSAQHAYLYQVIDLFK